MFIDFYPPNGPIQMETTAICQMPSIFLRGNRLYVNDIPLHMNTVLTPFQGQPIEILTKTCEYHYARIDVT